MYSVLIFKCFVDMSTLQWLLSFTIVKYSQRHDAIEKKTNVVDYPTKDDLILFKQLLSLVILDHAFMQ